jgi:Fe-S cluster assembly protein SufD
MSVAAAQAQFDAHRAALTESVETAGLRADALARFAARGFPTRRDEHWHYTDLRPIEGETFDFVPPAPSAAVRTAVQAQLAIRSLAGKRPRLVFVDGHFDEVLSTPPSSASLSIEPADTPRPEGESEPALALLNTAFADGGLRLLARRGHRAPEAIDLVFVDSGRSGIAAQPRVVIVLEENAELMLVQHFIEGPDAAASGWLNLVTNVEQAAGSHLTLYRFQEQNERHFHTSLLRATLGRDAELTAGCVDLGGRLVRSEIDIALAEPGSRADVFGLLFPSSNQHIDSQIRVDHRAPQTTSVVASRGIAEGTGRGVFCGKVVVRPGAQRIDAKQNSDNLLLSEKAEIDTKPELEIYADDVKCSHGATVGELDETHLFYLRSRGMAEEAARGLLTFAFANTILERIAPVDLRERAAAAIAGQLPDPVDLESLR